MISIYSYTIISPSIPVITIVGHSFFTFTAYADKANSAKKQAFKGPNWLYDVISFPDNKYCIFKISYRWFIALFPGVWILMGGGGGA